MTRSRARPRMRRPKGCASMSATGCARLLSRLPSGRFRCGCPLALRSRAGGLSRARIAFFASSSNGDEDSGVKSPDTSLFVPLQVSPQTFAPEVDVGAELTSPLNKSKPAEEEEGEEAGPVFPRFFLLLAGDVSEGCPAGRDRISGTSRHASPGWPVLSEGRPSLSLACLEKATAMAGGGVAGGGLCFTYVQDNRYISQC